MIDNNTQVISHIKNGNETESHDEFPFICSYTFNFASSDPFHFGAVSILNANWYLTAAHVVIPDFVGISTIRCGIWDFSDDTEAIQTRNITKYFIHENFLNSTEDFVAPYDIALVYIYI